mmetsp:Transcript_9255/g.38931  ORF Transcript_9255/g.38931 Transcript_9255/m.38931 type:complete len:202 (-) Transcript_9255:1578-2183(-)
MCGPNFSAAARIAYTQSRTFCSATSRPPARSVSASSVSISCRPAAQRSRTPTLQNPGGIASCSFGNTSPMSWCVRYDAQASASTANVSGCSCSRWSLTRSTAWCGKNTPEPKEGPPKNFEEVINTGPCSSSQRGIRSGWWRIWHASSTETTRAPCVCLSFSATAGEGRRSPVLEPATVCNTTTHAGSALSAFSASRVTSSS